MKHNIKQALCGAVVLTGIFLAVLLPVGLVEADRYGQALLAAAGCFTAVHIAAKAGGLYWAAPGGGLRAKQFETEECRDRVTERRCQEK